MRDDDQKEHLSYLAKIHVFLDPKITAYPPAFQAL